MWYFCLLPNMRFCVIGWSFHRMRIYINIFVLPYFEISLVYGELWKTGMFERMSLQTDEDEHSIEMHLPYTAKAMERYTD